MIPETGRGDCGVGGGLCPECVVAHHLSEVQDAVELAYDTACDIAAKAHGRRALEKGAKVPHVPHVEVLSPQEQNLAFAAVRCPRCNAAVNAALKIERAACAKIADDVANLAQARCSARQNDFGAVATAKNIADAIRAREP